MAAPVSTSPAGGADRGAHRVLEVLIEQLDQLPARRERAARFLAGMSRVAAAAAEVLEPSTAPDRDDVPRDGEGWPDEPPSLDVIASGGAEFMRSVPVAAEDSPGAPSNGSAPDSRPRTGNDVPTHRERCMEAHR